MLNSRWIVSAGVTLLSVIVLSGLLSSPQGAPEKVTPQVEVVNFPPTQGVSGTVNVGNFPAVQGVEVMNGGFDVSGEVAVSNLPVDSAGNLRVAEQAGGASAATVHLRFFESERGLFGRFGPYAIPPGFSKAMMSATSLDTTRTAFRSTSVWFSSSTAPLQHTALGDLIIYHEAGSIPNEGSTISPFVNGDQISFILDACGMTPSGCLDPPSPDSEYYVHIYLTR